jgi:uncharacterized protein (TIGR02099 family)
MAPSNPKPPAKPEPPTGAAAKAGEAIEAAEELVERAVIAAEHSLALRIGQRGLRIVLAAGRVAWLLTLVTYFVFALAVLVTRYYLLPHIDDWRPRIESAASAALHAPVTIATIEADWQGLHPRLRLGEVAIKGSDGLTTLALGQVDAVLSWTSLLALQPRMHSLSLTAPQILVKRLRDNRFDVAGFLIDPQAPQTDSAVLDWVLAQGRISVRGASVQLIDELGDAGAPGGTSPPAAVPAAPHAGAARGAHAVLAAFTPAAVPDAALPPVQYNFTDVNFELTRGLTGHRFSLRLRPPADLAGPLDLRGHFSHGFGEPTSRMTAWSGQMFLQFDDVDLARLQALVRLIPAPARLDRARGAMRAWMDFSALRITRVRADVALTGVEAQWRPDLDAMRLDSVRGRITQTLTSDREGETQTIALTGLSMDGPEQLHLPPTDLLFRTTRARDAHDGPAAEQSRFEASRIVLADWSRLARQFPLPVSWLNLIERTAAQGTLEDLHASWDGPQTPPRNYALRTQFSGLGFKLGAPTPAETAEERKAPEAPERGEAAAAPGGELPDTAAPAPYAVENLAGFIDLTQASGSLRLEGNGVRLQVPPWFGERMLALDALAAQLRWMRDAQSRWNVNVDSLAAANEDIDLRGSGSYRSGISSGISSGAGSAAAADTPRLDMSGRIVRAKVSAVPRYLPPFLPGPTRAWLQGALLDGSVSDGSFYVRGDPRHFPFVDPHSGDFHVGLPVLAGRIDFAPEPGASGASGSALGPGVEAPRGQRWPELSGIDGDVNFDRDRLAIAARRAKAYGYELSNITAQIAHLALPNQHLTVDGQGSGSVTEMLRYVAASPVNPWTGGWLGSAKGSGPARLGLKLDIPLARAVDTTVAGSVNFQGANVVLRPDVPPFNGVNGTLEFTQRGIRLAGLSAGFLGGEVRLNGDTRADGAVTIQGSGTATPQELHGLLPAAPLQRLLDAAHGPFHYNASLVVQRDALGLQVDSDLLGTSTNLPAPFRKTAAEARAFHLEIAPVAGTKPARDTLRVSLLGGLDVELQRIAAADGSMQIERGVIGIGAHANMPDSGVLLFVDQAGLDVDRWQALLNPTAPAGAASANGAETPKAPAAASGGAAPVLFDQVVLRAKSLTVAAKTISNVSLSARRDSNQTWLADIDSDEASGSVRWTEAALANHAHLMARLAKLTIPERDQKQVSDLLATPPTEFPDLDIVADQFELGKHNLGRLELAAQSTGEGPTSVWNLGKLLIGNPDGKVTGSGAWQREGAGSARRMNLKIAVNCTNAGGMLDRFGLSSYVKNGNGKLEGDLSWIGTPFSIDFPSLSGNLHLAAEKGQVLRLEAGAGRLLAVFSFQSFWSLVKGDLREFSAGVAFDSVSANAAIAQGVLSTDDFLMKGNIGAGRIKGSLDLQAQTQNLQIVIVPEVSASAATLAYAAFVNPAIGLSTFVGSFLLNKPLAAVFTRSFSVTGSWSDPQIKSIRGQTAAPATAPASPSTSASSTAPEAAKP